MTLLQTSTNMCEKPNNELVNYCCYFFLILFYQQYTKTKLPGFDGVLSLIGVVGGMVVVGVVVVCVVVAFTGNKRKIDVCNYK